MKNRIIFSSVSLLIFSLMCLSSGTANAVIDGPEGAGDGGWASSYEMRLAETGYGVGLMGGYGVEVGDPPELDIAQVMPSVSFPVTGAVGDGFYRGVLEYKIEGVLGYVDNLNHRGQLGLSPVGFRYNLTGSGGRLVPFVEAMLGAVYLNVPKTIQGTRFNFTESFGAGVRVFVSEGFALEASARFRHLSNAGIREPNPGINTAFVLVGVSYY